MVDMFTPPAAQFLHVWMTCKLLMLSTGWLSGHRGTAAEGKGGVAVPLPAWLLKGPWLQLHQAKAALHTALELLPPLLSSP